MNVLSLRSVRGLPFLGLHSRGMEKTRGCLCDHDRPAHNARGSGAVSGRYTLRDVRQSVILQNRRSETATFTQASRHERFGDQRGCLL